MARFCDLGVKTETIIGKKIEIEELFDKRVLIERTLISPTKYPGKNTSGLRLQMQVVLATFNNAPDSMGDYYVKDDNGIAIGERRSCFTGSDNLIKAIQQIENQSGSSSYPIDTIIVKTGKCFQFT